MNLHKRVLFAAATALVVAAAPASAGQPGAISSTSWIMTNHCGGTVYVSCATVTASVSGSVLTLLVTHTASSFSGTRFGAIGFIGATTGTIYGFGAVCDATHSCFTGAGDWDVDNSINDLQVNNVAAKGGDENQGDGLFVPESVTFFFRLSSGTWNLTNAIFAAHSQGGDTNCSSKIYINAAGDNISNQGVVTPTPTTAQVTAACGTPDNPFPPTSIPEPATMGLLALGLVGMGGVGFIRRRRKV